MVRDESAGLRDLPAYFVFSLLEYDDALHAHVSPVSKTQGQQRRMIDSVVAHFGLLS